MPCHAYASINICSPPYRLHPCSPVLSKLFVTTGPSALIPCTQDDGQSYAMKRPIVDHREEVDSAAPVISSRSDHAASSNEVAVPATSGTGSCRATATQSAGGKPGQIEVSNDSASPPAALDALINTEIHTPRGDGGGGVGAGTGGNGAGNGLAVKKKSGLFGRRFFVGAEKNAAGRGNGGGASSGGGGSGGGGGGSGAGQQDHMFSALSVANTKGRDPAGVDERGSSSSRADKGGSGSAVSGGAHGASAGASRSGVSSASSSRKGHRGGVRGGG